MCSSDLTIEIEVGDRVLIDGADVTDQIRAPEISERASKVAADQGVRDALVAKQQALMALGDVGRRLGAVPRRQRDGAVHRPCIEVGEAELARDGASHRGLAGSGRAVDRDDHSAGEVS